MTGTVSYSVAIYAPTLSEKADIMLGLRLDKDLSGGRKYSVCMQILPLLVSSDTIITPFCEDELNVNYTVNAQASTETYAGVVPRYVMLHVQWKFNKAPVKK